VPLVITANNIVAIKYTDITGPQVPALKTQTKESAEIENITKGYINNLYVFFIRDIR
jgi:hypothetical protein